MRMDFNYTPIGTLRTLYKSLDAIPKIYGEALEAEGQIEVAPEYEAALLGIEQFSHLIVIFAFDKSTSKLLQVTPPHRTEKRGVFATRSPVRPNAIGVLTVALLRREGNTLLIQGVDVLDGTPVLDIKPYLSHYDSRPEARSA